MAAKRISWKNPIETPKSIKPAIKPEKLAWRIANAETRPPNINTIQANTKPNRLPLRCINKEAGKVASMVNKNSALNGAVAQVGLGERDAPIMPPEPINEAFIDIPSAWHKARKKRFLSTAISWVADTFDSDGTGATTESDCGGCRY